MSDQWQPDTETLTRDDLLLDALGAGEPIDDDDDLLLLALATWRSDLDTGLTDDPVPAVAPVSVAVIHRPRSRRTRRLALVAAVVLAFGGGVAAGAATAEPGSPLWPITRVVYTDRAQTITTTAARKALDEAQTAVSEGRRGDAQRLITKAETLIADVRSDGVRNELQQRLDQIRASLASIVADTITPAPLPAPTSTPALPGPSSKPSSGSKPTPANSPLLPLPSLPLPSLPLPNLPLPSLSLPPLLPR